MGELATVPTLSRGEARNLTDRIKASAEELWHLLLEAYEGGAHLALGYASWGAYYETEFGGHARSGYRLLDAGRVVRAVEGTSDQLVTEAKPNEAQARELAPLAKEDPDKAAKLWDEVVQEHGEKVTAEDVKQAVSERADFKDYLKNLPPLTRAALEQADEGFDKHRNLLRNSNQLNMLANIARKRGDEVAAEVAERALTEEGGNVFTEYDRLKEEQGEEATEEETVEKARITRIQKMREMKYVVEFSDGDRGTVDRSTILEHDFKKCQACKGFGVLPKESKR